MYTKLLLIILFYGNKLEKKKYPSVPAVPNRLQSTASFSVSSSASVDVFSR